MTINYKRNFQKHSKTFSFAAKFFGKKTGTATAKLYYFFRTVDDLADSELEMSIDERKDLIRQALNSSEIKQLKKQYNIPNKILEVFINYSIADIDLERLNCEKELLSYCYGVASTVGLSMCHLFGVTSEKAFYHAIDLGIAMQLTNMCRDVFEDYENNRIYLPDLIPEYFKYEDQDNIFSIQKKYLDLADEYYLSGFEGLIYLPIRARLVVYIAAKLYHHIGHQILIDKNFKKRSYVSKFSKIGLSLQYVCSFLFKHLKMKDVTHQQSLHKSIVELPYANQ